MTGPTDHASDAPTSELTDRANKIEKRLGEIEALVYYLQDRLVGELERRQRVMGSRVLLTALVVSLVWALATSAAWAVVALAR